jgi:hypothetical protein
MSQGQYRIFDVSAEIKEYFPANFAKKDGVNLEELIFLKEVGCSQMHTALLLNNLGSLSFHEANAKVFNSIMLGLG